MSEGRPLSKTVLFTSSKNCCAYSSSSFRFAIVCACFEILPEPRGVEGVVGAVGWDLEVEDCFGVAVRFFGALSRDGVFTAVGVVLTGFFSDFRGSLKWRLGQD